MTGPPRWPVVLTMVLACAGASVLGQPPDERLDDSTKAITARAAAYVADYQARFAFLVSDEHYVQTVTRGNSVRRRVMNGELFLTFLRADHEWIAVHDVAEVDGEAVPDRENLQTLLQRADVTSVAQRIADRNAAFNIGSVTRNFNEPTLALLVLEAKRIGQFKFDRRDETTQDGVTVATLAFREHKTPTLVHGMLRNAVYSTGELVVEVASGTIRRTIIGFQDEGVTARLTTDYALDSRLGLWVPTGLMERYDLQQSHQPTEVTNCEASYTNYRRFEVTGRIKH